MNNLNEMGLVELRHDNIKKINGGILLGPWGALLKGARYLLEAAGAIDAVIEFKDGYQNCRCQS